MSAASRRGSTPSRKERVAGATWSERSAEGLIDEELGALGGTVEPRFGLASREAVEGQVGAPRQDEDKARTAQAGAKEEPTLERRGRANDRLVRRGDRRHEMSRAEGAS